MPCTAGSPGFSTAFCDSKLGFKATLKNDRLTLRGVESRGDEEYLVVGSFLPPTVNIVSHTQTIGFSELLRRLQRMTKRRSRKSNNNTGGSMLKRTLFLWFFFTVPASP